LHDRHEALGASFTDFGGWTMPVRYTSDLAEHRAVRESAGLFDISHMAEFQVAGAGAAQFLDYVMAGRMSRLPLGRAKYSLVLAEDGGIVDDVIVYRTGHERFLVVANAGNRDAVAGAFSSGSEHAPIAATFVTEPREAADAVASFASASPSPDGTDGARIEDVTDRLALIAVQGPRAEQVLRSAEGLAADDLSGLAYYAWQGGTFQEAPVFIARTGYTGEDGFELLTGDAHAESLWDALLAAGAPHGLVPAGLAARDTLRLEAGMPLYGHELSRDVGPAQAGLARVVAMDKADFVGKEGLLRRELDSGDVLVGLVAEGRRAGRAGYAVTGPDGRAVGRVTSGALSPTLGRPIAMAFVPLELAEPGTALAIDVRGTAVPAIVTTLPFYRRTT